MDSLLDTRGQQRIKSFLLLYLFVVRTLGDCTYPELGENIVLSNEALLLNEFPNNIEISLECANGYVKDSGSGFIKCIGEAWSDLDITCKKKDCGEPAPQPHMNFDTSQGTLFGAVVTVSCDKGYRIKGVSYKHCYNVGWSGRATCEIVTCNKLAQVSDGKSSWDSADFPKYGENIQYVCDEGFTLVGKDTLMCTENGEYDSPPPQCQGSTKDVFTTKMLTPTSTPPSQEASTSTDSRDTTTGHRDKTLTASATPRVSLSTQGGGDSLNAEDSTTSSVTSPMTSFFEEEREIVDTNKDVGYTPVIISVVCVSLVVCVAVLFIHKSLLKRKGSYDTREDLKPELLHFQNL